MDVGLTFLALLERDGNDVEPNAWRHLEPRLVSQPHVSVASELLGVDGHLGIDRKLVVRRQGPGLDLDEDVLGTIPTDDVRLSLRAAPVPVEDLIAPHLKKRGRNVLSKPSHLVRRQLTDGLVAVVERFHGAPFDAGT